MTKVDFYLLHSSSERREGDSFACRLADKAFQQGKQVLIHAVSQQHASSLDKLLWEVPATGFVPHTSADKKDSQLHSQVTIDYTNDPGEHDDCLINLAETIPDYCARFQRICEIVVYSDEARAISREHFKFYKDRGFPISTHDIK